jgi:hypothetical protein
MTTLTKNLFIHAVSAWPGIPAIPAHCFEDGSATSVPNPANNPIKWDGSGVGTGTGGTGMLPKYAFGRPNATVLGDPILMGLPMSQNDIRELLAMYRLYDS